MEESNGRDAGVSSSNLAVRERPKPMLKKRSKNAGDVAGYVKSDKPSPFGAARPREEILKAKGVDYKKVEADLSKRTAKIKLMSTLRDQHEELKAARSEVSFAQESLKNAETEEERTSAELEVAQKEKEIAEMLENFKKINLEKLEKKKGDSKGNGQRPFIRASERRRMRAERERERRNNNGDGNYYDNKYDLPPHSKGSTTIGAEATTTGAKEETEAMTTDTTCLRHFKNTIIVVTTTITADTTTMTSPRVLEVTGEDADLIDKLLSPCSRRFHVTIRIQSIN